MKIIFATTPSGACNTFRGV